MKPPKSISKVWSSWFKNFLSMSKNYPTRIKLFLSYGMFLKFLTGWYTRKPCWNQRNPFFLRGKSDIGRASNWLLDLDSADAICQPRSVITTYTHCRRSFPIGLTCSDFFYYAKTWTGKKNIWISCQGWNLKNVSVGNNPDYFWFINMHLNFFSCCKTI